MMSSTQSTAIGNMHKQFGKDRAWFQRYPCRQTHRHKQTQRYSPRCTSYGRGKV